MPKSVMSSAPVAMRLSKTNQFVDLSPMSLSFPASPNRLICALFAEQRIIAVPAEELVIARAAVDESLPSSARATSLPTITAQGLFGGGAVKVVVPGSSD